MTSDTKFSTVVAEATATKTEIATLGAGCFWHTEEAFRQCDDIVSTSVGYMGGHFANPCYLDVLSRITGHAEVAQIHYDPTVIDYTQLLTIFWQCHNPTTLNRQGPDRGEQYRSVIFYHTQTQRQLAITSKNQLDNTNAYTNPIVTEIKPAGDYWLAPEEHQQYLSKKKIKRKPQKAP